MLTENILFTGCESCYKKGARSRSYNLEEMINYQHSYVVILNHDKCGYFDHVVSFFNSIES